MSATLTRFKFFWAHEDEQQETWLRAMAQQGLHLVDVNPACFWTFRRGEPADIAYRVDFSNADQDPGFQQLMPLIMAFVLTDKQKMLDQMSLPFLVPTVLVLVLYVLLVPYSILRLLLRIRQSRGRLSA